MASAASHAIDFDILFFARTKRPGLLAAARLNTPALLYMALFYFAYPLYASVSMLSCALSLDKGFIPAFASRLLHSATVYVYMVFSMMLNITSSFPPPSAIPALRIRSSLNSGSR